LENFIGKCLQLSPAKRPTAKDLLSMFPETYEPVENDFQFQVESEINLLSTIKVPRNLNSWRNDLPKADYENNPM
jgi:serine/threonine protein kinase